MKAPQPDNSASPHTKQTAAKPTKKGDKKNAPAYAQSSDYGTAQRNQHDGGLVIEPAERSASGRTLSTRARAAYTSSLHWYLNKGTITQPMLDAGLIFALWFNKAGIHSGPRSCLANPIRIDTSRTASDWTMAGPEDARRKIARIYEILDPLERDVIRSVAGMDERASGDRRVLALKTGLRALVTYYKIPVNPLPA